jgi:uncharacterized membrane protein YgcG
MKTRTALIIVVILILTETSVHAQGNEPPIPAAPPDGTYILDELDWLSSTQEDIINSTIKQLDHDGIAEIAVVILNDCGSDKEAFRKSLFDTWGIGHKDDNDGLLILVCWYDGDASHRSVEQLYGPGLNRMLTSHKTDQIAQEKFVPAFQQGKPGDGVVGMVRAYNLVLRTPEQHSKNVFTSLVQWFNDLNFWIAMPLLFFVLIGIIYALDKIGPKSFRSKFERDPFRQDYSDRDGFDGGHSDGGGGSSTRF